MYWEDGNLRISPSDLIVFLESEFASWMDRWLINGDDAGPHAESVQNRKGSAALKLQPIPDEDDLQTLLFAKKGTQHELAFLGKLKRLGKQIVEIDQGDPAFDGTLGAMKDGADFIYQARLETAGFGGWADFLVKRDGASAIGPHHYEPWDTKLARSPKAHFIVQLCGYADLLEQVQGHRPTKFEIVLGDGTRAQFRTNSYYYYYRELRLAFEEFLGNFDPSGPPPPGLSREYGRWKTYAEGILEESDHLSVIANITRGQIRKIEEAGVSTASAFANSAINYVPGMASEVLEHLKTQAKLQIKSKEVGKPLYQVREADPSNGKLGLMMLPSASPNDVFFDIEGFPMADRGLEYLFGAAHLESGKPEFSNWWAHDSNQEERAFEEFIDWAHARWSHDPTMHIYHYAAYETTAVRRLMGQYATREQEVDDLLRNKVFIDCYTIVRQSLIIGTPGYSLKDIEVLYGPKRSGEINTASGSVVAYAQWLESGESQDWQESAILSSIREYNQADCESLTGLVEWLREVQLSSGIEYNSDPAKDIDSEPDTRSERAEVLLAERLISDVASGAIVDSEHRRIQELLAWLLEFHWREARPVFWRKFDRREMTERELVDDLDCLGAMQRTGKPPDKDKRSLVYQYTFDPDQDTKLEAGSGCFFAHDLAINTSIASIDREKGLVEIKLGPTKPTPSDRLSLIPDEYVRADTIANSVYKYVEAWSQGQIVSQAVDDLLHRRRPRVKGQTGGILMDHASDSIPQIMDVVERLDSSVLCIQGPPGCGKTFTSAAVIAALLKNGKRIGVTANGHKTIINLLESVVEQADSIGLKDANIIKVGGSPDDPLLKSGKVKFVAGNAGGFQASGSGPAVVGGTAWMFCREEWEGNLDYLFVDEAGQFSLANVVGVGLSSNNLVLVGDQMQLAQPIQGSHPGESGKSALEYYLNGLATIPDDLGVFLDTTWRMHPDISGFISEAIYENRLTSHPRMLEQRVLPSDKAGLITQETGLVYIPVPHEGNTQCSPEEVDTIDLVMKGLLASQVQDATGIIRPLTLEDILVVAPYNMQVRRLSERLGQGAQVGTVDRFQGLEAHVVIVSMAASSIDESPRGAEFLLSPNRINVAVSRAKSLAIVVSSPELLRPRCQTIKQMELVNLFCWLKAYATNIPAD